MCWLVLLDDAGKAEALHMLHRIRELREQHTKTLPPVMNKVYHTLAMLHYVLQDFNNVRCLEFVCVSIHILL